MTIVHSVSVEALKGTLKRAFMPDSERLTPVIGMTSDAAIAEAMRGFAPGLSGGPKTITLLPTYRCTAACEQCCFGSNPHVKERMSLEEMLALVDEAVESFSALKVLVISGGECYMLGDDLMKTIERGHSKGLSVRTVSNGYWGKSQRVAARTARQAAACGLKEANFSTGRDHAEFVPVAHVINAAVACVEAGIFTLVTVEQDAEDSAIYDQIVADERIRALQRNPSMFQLRVNSWMKFTDSHIPRGADQPRGSPDIPCDQLFENLVVTPKRGVSSCCGLTFEYIPELKVGTWPEQSLKEMFARQADDSLKIWVHLDGPVTVVRKVAPEYLHLVENSEHLCQACASMYREPAIRKAIRERYAEHLPSVLTRFHLKRVMDSQGVRI